MRKLVTQTIVLLVLGFIIIQGATLFIVTSFWQQSSQRFTKYRLANEVIKVVQIARKLPPEQLDNLITYLQQPGLRLNVIHQAPSGLQKLVSFNPALIHREVMQSGMRFELQYPLASNRILQINSNVITPSWILVEFGFAIALVLLVIIALCTLVVYQLALPIDRFAQAAKRITNDIHTSPLAESGPQAVRIAIQTFNTMQSRLQQLIHDRTQMLAAISHDLRTPITRLKLRAEALENEKLQAKMIHDLDEMDYMVSSMLTFAKQDHHTQQKEWFDINALVDSVCVDLSEMGYQIDFVAADDPINFFGELSSIKRAISNLIENAVKYGKKADVSISSTDKTIEIRVMDEGPGIPPQELENVFQPFYRLNKARTPHIIGSGLGLVVARDIVRSHGGELSIKNRKPTGLIATIRLLKGE